MSIEICITIQRYDVQTISSKRYTEDKLNSTTIKYDENSHCLTHRKRASETLSCKVFPSLSLEVYVSSVSISLISNFSQKLTDLHEATTLSVHFKDLTCIKYRRDMYMTWDGLLGMKNKMNSNSPTAILSFYPNQLHSAEYSVCVWVDPSSV